MPPSPLLSEHTPSASPKGDDPSPVAASDIPQRDPVGRLRISQHGTTLPPVAALTGYGITKPQIDASPVSGSPTALRTFGMHSLLNPATDTDFSRRTQRITRSPARNVNPGYESQQLPLKSSRVRKRKDDASPARMLQTLPEPRQNRRVLTPKSPGLRSFSQGARASPSSGTAARLSVAPSEGRLYTAEPGAEIRGGGGGVIPPLPPMAITAHSPFGSVALPDLFPSTGTASHSNSTASHSTNNQAYVGSPDSFSNVPERDAPSPFRPALVNSISHAQTSQLFMPAAEPQNRHMSRSYGTGQASYEMKLDTEQGPMIVPVELDIQQASKLADEKRKRNAGASARFRQRRKEKEHAASHAISELQRQLREANDERDYYMGERDWLRDFISRTPGIQLPPRAPSPQSRRRPSAAEYGRRDVAEPSPAQRRRTSDYQPSFTAASPIMPVNYAPPYPPHQAPPYVLPTPSLSGSLQDLRSQPLAPGPPPPNGPLSGPLPPSNIRHQPYDPFRRENNPR